MDVDKLLHEAVERGASDLHVTVGVPPTLRVDGTLVPMDYPRLKPADTNEIFAYLTNDDHKRKFKEYGEVDFSFAMPRVSRFRVNAYQQRGATGVAIRLIRETAPTLDELGHPEIVKTLARKARGLVLVTGPTGSGKSTTLAAMIDLINNERACHIITLEDPIEYLHRHGMSVINQREINSDTKSFTNGLRAALREDPDVILLGEMRDVETIGIAITAAETGHLVFATLHTADTPQTIDRIIDVFPPYQQQQVRTQLSLTLQGIVAQQLLPRADGGGRIAALEVMVATPAVRNLIREGKNHQLLSVLQTGGKFGMQTMDSALRDLYRTGTVTYEEAYSRAMDPETFNQLISGGSSMPGLQGRWTS